jgi:hypothetical protein
MGGDVPSSSNVNVSCSGGMTRDGVGGLGWLSVPVCAQACRCGTYVGAVVVRRVAR